MRKKNYLTNTEPLFPIKKRKNIKIIENIKIKEDNLYNSPKNDILNESIQKKMNFL